MKACRLIASFVTTLILTSTCAAVDLTKINRIIHKEPAYRHQPKYGLAVFGPEAKTRVWMVLDGDVLYVDRNGNGDLTEKGECIKAYRPNGKVAQFEGGELDGMFGFDVGEVVGEIVAVDGKIGKCNMFVFAFADRNSWGIACSLSGSSRSKSPWMGDFSWCVGSLGVFHGFVGKREEAPIFHFSGPLTFDLARKADLTLAGGKKTQLSSLIGTPGLGEGTFATFMIANAQEALGDKGPDAEIELASPDAKGRPMIIRTSLNKRACGAFFHNTVQIPKEAGKAGKAKITLALPHPEMSTIGKVAPATFEVPIGESGEKKSRP